MKQITFKQYKCIDITILCALTAIFEAIATYATNYFFAMQAMAVSITLTMTCIMMIRWGVFAMLPSFVGSFVYCLVCRIIGNGGTVQHFIIYCCGSLLCVASLIVVRLIGKDKIRASALNIVIFTVSTYLSVVLGRWLCSLAFELSLKSFLSFALTDILSLLFALVVLVGLSKSTDGMLEDQKSYLLRLDRERKEENQN